MVGASEERRKTTDGKLAGAQSAIDFMATLAGGSLALTFLQAPVYDLWHVLVLLSLSMSVVFFGLAAHKVVQANDPRGFQVRRASATSELLERSVSKRELQLDAIKGYLSIIKANDATLNARLTLYRATIENIRKAILCAGAVPVILLLGYVISAMGGISLPPFVRLSVGRPPNSSGTFQAQAKLISAILSESGARPWVSRSRTARRV